MNKQLLPYVVLCLLLLTSSCGQKARHSSLRDDDNVDKKHKKEQVERQNTRPYSVYGDVYDVVIGSFADKTEAQDYIRQMQAKGIDRLFCEECYINGEWTNRVIAFSCNDKSQATNHKQYLANRGIQSWIWNHYVEQTAAPIVSSHTRAMPPNEVFTCVYSTASDHFTNLRANPSDNSPVIGRLNETMHGNAGEGVLLEKRGEWYKIDVHGTIGYAYSRYVGECSWFSGDGKYVIVADKEPTRIYYDYTEDEWGDAGVFYNVHKGTVIADIDSKEEANDEYYYLITAHDGLKVKMSECKIKRADDL